MSFKYAFPAEAPTAGLLLLMSLAALPCFGAQTDAKDKRTPQEEKNVTTLSPVEVTADRGSSYRAATTSSATGTETPVEESPVVVDIVTRQMMDSRVTDSLDDVTKFESGVFNGGQTLYSRTAGQYSIRGMGGSDVTVNGLPFPSGMGFALDASVLERVDFVKGPIGSLNGGQTSTAGAYGAGGSVNIVMKQPEWEDFTRMDLSARVGEGQKYRGTMDFNQTNADKTVAFRMPLAVWEDKPFWLTGGADWGSGFAISPSILWKPTEKSRVMLQTSYQYQDTPAYMGIPVFGGHFAAPYNAWIGGPKSRSLYSGLLVLLSGEVKTNDTWTLRGGLNMGRTWTDYNIWGLSSNSAKYNEVLQTGRGYYEYAWTDSTSTTYGAYANASAKFDLGEVSNEALMGVDYTCRVSDGYSSFSTTAESFDIWHLTPPTVGSRIYNSKSKSDQVLNKTGVILQDMATWGTWRLLGGTRIDAHFSDGGNDAISYSPRAGFSKQLDKRWIWFGNFSQTESPNFGYKDINNQELTDSWVARQYESGLRFNPSDDLWITASAFRIEQSGTPLAITPGAGSSAYYVSEGRSRSKGFELSANGAVNPYWDSQISYTFIDYKNRTTGESYDRNPPHSVSLWQTAKLPIGMKDPFKISLGYRFAARYMATVRGMKIADNYTIPSSSVFDLVFEMPLPESNWYKDASVRFGIYNIFNEEYVTSMRHANQCFVGEPRSFELSLRMAF